MPDPTTFLLVEDDRNDVLLVELEFQDASDRIRLKVVNDGADAIDYISGRGDYADRGKFPMPNVILLDLKMRRVNGFQFLEWLRLKCPRPCRLIPVVIMSSSVLKEDIDRAYGLGANSYMVKPVDWDQFKERIRAMGLYWTQHVQKPELDP